MIFLFVSKHQSKAKFKKLDDSEVLRSDFQTLEPMQPPCPLQPHFIKINTAPDGWIPPSKQITNTGLFWLNGSSKNPNFH